MPRTYNLASTAFAVALCTTGYYLLPVGEHGLGGTVWAVAAFAVGLIVIAVLVYSQVRGYRSGRTSISWVVAAFHLAVLFFSAVYYAMAAHVPGALPGLSTKTDALYFSLTITGTVGFGDIHPVTQAARALVALHIAFNIAYLGTAVSALRPALPTSPAE
ncbi:two pore domain potassium channel family protein [Saccharopolyspora terrae]|uniref:Two pore domain potassium channel family protein n=1 Tax=Saccharopolyspora terrae TaxID=2530384 RepID=A0A4R4VN59_9PSEU|nr:potassium channel family protein [Saccharopolyspora terrae]TDD01470.1 two pore domain potassium channel family protein [Saccharopolyspora terrae]